LNLYPISIIRQITDLLLIGHNRSFPVGGRHIVYAGYTKKFIELWTNQKQTGDSALILSKGTKTIYVNSIRTIFVWPLDFLSF